MQPPRRLLRGAARYWVGRRPAAERSRGNASALTTPSRNLDTDALVVRRRGRAQERRSGASSEQVRVIGLQPLASLLCVSLVLRHPVAEEVRDIDAAAVRAGGHLQRPAVPRHACRKRSTACTRRFSVGVAGRSSLRKMLRTCASTVLWVTNSCWAIPRSSACADRRIVRPGETYVKTPRSAQDRGFHRCAASLAAPRSRWCFGERRRAPP